MTALELGESLKKFRKNLNLSQDDMAKDMGVSRTMYQSYEWGKSAPSALILINLADTHNVSIDYLLGRGTALKPNDIQDVSINAMEGEAAKTTEERLARLEGWFKKKGIEL